MEIKIKEGEKPIEGRMEITKKEVGSSKQEIIKIENKGKEE